MKLSQKQKTIVAIALLFVLVLLVLLVVGLRNRSGGVSVTLAMWGTDDEQVVDELLQDYNRLHPNVTVNYVKVDAADYYDRLLNALASGRGPDVFYVGNKELPKEKDKLAPADLRQFDLTKLRSLFPQAVEQDFTSAGQVYALPLYLDTLALIYNKDYFDQAGIVFPPKTWDDFLKIVPLLRSLGPNGQIVKAAAAIGGSEKTVDSGTDLLELLLIQNGAKMTSDDNSYAAFASRDAQGRGLAAFNFYLQFANAGSSYYTWNDGQAGSLDGFSSGQAAMIFNYQSAVPMIKNKSPFLNFAVAPMPQVTGANVDVNFPRYYGLAVSKQSPSAAWAWDLAMYFTTDAGANGKYLKRTGRPPALRSFIAADLNSPDLGVFAKQALTARSWYQIDDGKVKDIFNAAIQSVLTGRADSATALNQAQDQISGLMLPSQ